MGVALSQQESVTYREAVSAFADVAAAVGADTDLETLLGLVAERLGALLGVAHVEVELTGHRPGRHAALMHEAARTRRPVVHDGRLGVPLLVHGEVLGLLVVGDGERDGFDAGAQALSGVFADLVAMAIVQTRLTTDLRRTLSTTARQNQALRRAAALEDRLTTLVLEGADLGAIAGAVTEMTGKGCSVIDASSRCLSHRPTPDTGEDAPFDPAVLAAPEVVSAFAAVTARRPAVVGPLPAAGLRHRCLVAKVRVGADDRGFLVLSEHGRQLGSQDVLVAQRTATIIALELSGRRRRPETDAHAVESLVRDLVHDADGAQSLRRRVDYHGLALGERPTVVLLAPVQRTVGCGEVRTVLARVAPDLRCSLAAVERGIVGVVAQDGDGPGRLKSVLEQVIAALGGHVTAAVATAAGLGDLPRTFRQVAHISRGIATFARDGTAGVWVAEDLGPGRLLMAASDRAEADRFVRATLGALLTADTAGGSLLTTLRVFVDCARNVRRTAERLGVHENTVRYRISRVAALTGHDPAGGDDGELALEMALLILRVEGRL